MKKQLSILSIKLPYCFRRGAKRARWFYILSILYILSTNTHAQETTIDKTNIFLYERVTLHPQITNSYANPFDSEEIKVDAEIISPSGKKWTAPGFFIQPYSGKIINGKEKIEKSGKPEWQVRLSFSEPGKHKIKITAKDKNGTRTLGTASLRISSCKLPSSVLCPLSSDSGFIRCNKTDHRYFVDDNGKTYFPVGANICWSFDKPQGVFVYDYCLPKYAEQGCNFFRLWLSPAWCNFALRSHNSGFYKFDQKNAYHIDHVLELAEKLNMRIMFAIDTYNSICSNKNAYGMFDKSPCNIKNGGPVEKPIDYFTNLKVKKANYNRLRYLVARYGYSPNVFAWEFWNEVDGSEAYYSKDGEKIITDWHKNSAQTLKKIDPWNHLITTSFAHDRGRKNIEILPEMDLIQIHHYNSPDLANTLSKLWKERLETFEKPFFQGEFGYATSGLNDDPKGVHLHNALFASVGGLCAGAPMVWFWDSYIEPNNLYHIYGSFGNWISGFDFIKQKAKPIDAELEFRNPNEKHKRENLLISTFEHSWDRIDLNKPTTLKIPNDITFDSEKIVAMFIQGSNHANFYNPQTFVLNATKPAKFIIKIDKISGWGGAVMNVFLDKKLVMEKVFIDPDGITNTASLKQYSGEYKIDIPVGKHKITIKNTGADWFEIKQYLIPNYVESKKPTLRVSGIAGKTKALIWIKSPYYIWSKAYENNFKPHIYKNVRLIVKNLEYGIWIVEEFNTQNGKVNSIKKMKVEKNGELKINLPEISWDIAYRLIYKTDSTKEIINNKL